MIVDGRSLVLDNYDSFTWNLVHLMRICGDDPIVLRNDDTRLDSSLRPRRLVISPGPGRPEAAGRCLEVLDLALGQIPVLGVCLGHQAIGLRFGMELRQAPEAIHGKVSAIDHDGRGLFAGVRSGLRAMRYHSLILGETSRSTEIEVSATTRGGDRNLVMGLRHKTWPVTGIQFHPESFLTEDGRRMMENFLSW